MPIFIPISVPISTIFIRRSRDRPRKHSSHEGNRRQHSEKNYVICEIYRWEKLNGKDEIDRIDEKNEKDEMERLTILGPNECA